MKRIITFMMALALVLSLSVTAFAAGDGSITITNATEGENYSVYKIFDAAYAGDNVAYTLTDSTLEGYMFGADAVVYTDIGKAEDFFDFNAETKVVTLKENANEANLFKYLGKLVKDGKVTVAATTTASGDTVNFSELETGYYVIDRESGSANGVTITTTKPHADVIDKNRLPSDLDKTSDNESVSVGDTINWTLKLTASNYNDGEKIVSYTIWDKLNPSGWAEIDTDSIQVLVNDTVITDWALVEDENVDFKIDIPWAVINGDGEFVAFKYGAVVELKVIYSATVMDDAVANDPTTATNLNSADFEYDTEVRVDVPGEGDETDTEVYNMGFTKVDGTTNAGLASAEFTLTDEDGDAVKVSGGNGVYIVDPSGSDTIVTPADGQVVIQGLAEGKYYLTETKAPEGYNKLDAAVEVNVSKDAADELTIGEEDYKVSNAQLDIANNSGVELPSTGGVGTMMMISFGTMVAIAFAILMITQKKMSVYRD